MDKKEKKDEKKKKKFAVVKEFKEFISRGNVMDLAVGVIIGSAFTAIVNSVANNIITPVIGILIGGIDFSSLKVNLPSIYSEAEKPVLAYGVFIQAIINFFIIAVCVFVIIKFMNTLKSKIELEKKEEKPPEKAADVLLLEEIRDLLKQQKGGEINEINQSIEL
jgi:large conductance mechanosensitive channel